MRYKAHILAPALQDIQESIQIEYRDLRHASVHRFPYLIHYQVDEDKKAVFIFAITHTSRNPQLWKDRS